MKYSKFFEQYCSTFNLLPFTRWLGIIFLFFSICAHAQVNSSLTEENTPTFESPNYNTCATDEVHRQLMEDDNTYKFRKTQYEQTYQTFVKSDQVKKSSMIHTIPVVVHIVHSGKPLGTAENPTDDMIRNTIEQVSERFRHTHSGADTYTNPFYGVDTEIDLCLATTDPNGNYTTGIIRHEDAVNTIMPSSTYLNSIEWDDDLYANIFIVEEINACGVYYGGSSDYTVYLASCFWSGLAAHEMGHYFSLAHIFSGNCNNNDCTAEGDYVCDTPPKPTYGYTEDPNNPGDPCGNPGDSCTSDEDDTSTNNPYRSVNLSGMGNQPDMLANYMDYTASCWDSFTEGQKTRMRFNIENYRTTQINNAAACNPVSTPPNDAGITDINIIQSDFCVSDIDATVDINNYGSATLNTLIIEVYVNGVLTLTENWAGNIAPGNSQTHTLSSSFQVNEGNSIVRIQTNSPNGNADANQNSDMDYASVIYIGSDCAIFNTCTDMNPNTASGPGNTTTVSIMANFPAVTSSEILVCVVVDGDNIWYYDVFDIIDESGNSLGITNSSGAYCAPSPPLYLNISSSDYNLWKSDGNITFSFNPFNNEINPALCSSNQICVDIIVPSDCTADISDFEYVSGAIPDDTYRANQVLMSNGSISNGGNASFKSGDLILLIDNFTVQPNTDFSAEIENCSTPNQ